MDPLDNTPDQSIEDILGVAMEDDDSQDIAMEGGLGDEIRDEHQQRQVQPESVPDQAEDPLPESDTKSDQESAKPEPEPTEAPIHWSVQDREMFAELNPKAQNFLLERSRAMEAAHTQRSQEIAPIRKAIEPYQGYLQQLGTNPAEAFSRLMGTEYTLRNGTNQQKVETLKQLVKDYGITPPDENEVAPDPRVNQLQQQLQHMQVSQQQQAQAVQEQRVAQASQVIEDFKNQKTEDGRLAHPYYGEVVDYMTAIISSDTQKGIQPDLKRAYDTACWASPVVRQRLLTEQNKANVQKKKVAGASVSGAGSNQPTNFDSVEAAVQAAYGKLAA